MRNIISVVRKFIVGASLMCVAALAFSANPAFGQISGDLVGTVKDVTGAVVPGASVTVKNEATGVSATTTSTNEGQYRFANLSPGTYDVVVTGKGFERSTVKGVAVDLSKTSTADVALLVGTSTTVEVETNAGNVLDTTSVNLTTTFDNEQLSTLPVTAIGQGVINTSLLVPGVGSTGGIGIGVGPSVAGQRQRDNNFMIEGIDNNSKSVTGPLVYVPNDAVGEFTLITTQFSPEFGHSAGAQFNTTVMSGTNHFHGKVYEYFDNRNLNAAFGTAGNKLPNARYDYNRYGAQLGGPIIHDKLFFFGNYERQTIGQSTQYSFCVPSAAGRTTIQGMSAAPGYSATNIAQYLKYEPTPNSTTDPNTICGLSSIALTSGPTDASGNQTGAAQGTVGVGVYNLSSPIFSNRDYVTTGFDYTLSSKDSLRGRYIYNTTPAFDTAATLSTFYLSNPAKFHLVSLSEFHNFTPNLVNELRIGFNRYANSTVVGPQTYPGLDSFPNLEFSDLSGSVTAQIGPDPNAPQFTIQNLYQLTDNVSYTKGKHTLKIGFDGRKYISPQGFTQRARGDYEYTNTSDFLHDFVPDVLGERSSGSHTYYGDQTALYGYGNDTYRATQTITFNVGLRYEFTSVPTGERAQALNSVASVAGLINFHAPKPAYGSFAPRVGVEFAPDSKTSIRAGFGMAYDVLFDNLGTLSFPPQYSVTQDVQPYGAAPCSSTPPVSGCPGFLAAGGLKPGTGSGTTVLSAADARAATSAYLPDQVVPYTESYSLTIERQVGKGLTAEIGYIGDHGVHLPAQQRINIQPETTTANYLPTLVNGTAINGKGANATTLAAIQANPTKYYVPAFFNAGFTGTVVSFAPVSTSNYNGLITSLKGHMKNGLQMQLSYTYSKTMDNATAEVFATSLTPRRPQNPQDFTSEYSRSGLDHTHRLTLEANYNFQAFKGENWLMRNLVANWVVSPIYTYESPEYATVLNGTNALLTNDGAYVGRTIINPNGVRGTVSKVTAITSGGNTVGYTAVNPNAYYIQAGAGALPNSSRNTLPGRPTDNVDISAYKRFTAFDHYTLEFGVQALNALNHAQYIPGSIDDTGTYSYTGTAYQTITSGTFNHPELNFGNNPRSMQLSGKIIF